MQRLASKAVAEINDILVFASILSGQNQVLPSPVCVSMTMVPAPKNNETPTKIESRVKLERITVIPKQNKNITNSAPSNTSMLCWLSANREIVVSVKGISTPTVETARKIILFYWPSSAISNGTTGNL
jgi:hypothetical protein